MAKGVEYSLGPNTYPRGWFIVAEAKELDEGPQPVKFFGQEFSLYRGESGKVVMMDAYCPHMGTHISASKSAHIAAHGELIEGDSIRCPYHGWRFDPTGQCDDIPYLDKDKIPRSAKIQAYHVEESMGCIFMWWDPDNAEPEYPCPSLEEWKDDQWVKWELDHLGELNLHPQEIIDNMADCQHLGPTHGAPCEYFENEFRDHMYIQRQGGFHKLYEAQLDTVTWYTGPGLLLSKQKFGDTLAIELIANTPVEDGVSRVWHAALHLGANNPPTEEDKAIAKEVQAGALQAFAADFDVWAHKRPATRIIQVKTDGPFRHGRDWYKQFYAKPEDVQAIREKLNGILHIDGFPIPGDAVKELEKGIANLN